MHTQMIHHFSASYARYEIKGLFNNIENKLDVIKEIQLPMKELTTKAAKNKNDITAVRAIALANAKKIQDCNSVQFGSSHKQYALRKNQKIYTGFSSGLKHY